MKFISSKVILIFLVLQISILYAQKTSIGLHTSLRSGIISEPINNNGSIIFLESHWFTFQVGLVLEYYFFEISDIPFKGFNKFGYGKNSNAFKYLVFSPNVNETEISTKINYIITFDQAILYEQMINNNIELDFGINFQLFFSQYKDDLIDRKSNYIRKYEDNSFTKLNLGPIIKVNLNLINNFTLSIGANYYLLKNEKKNFRITSGTEAVENHYSLKSINQIEYFLALLYNPF